MIGLAKLAAAVALLALVRQGQDPAKLLQLEQKFREQTDPVHRAKALAKLASGEIRAAQEEIRAGQTDQALGRLDRFRDDAREVYQALQASGINAVKRPAGFQELQIALRESVRRLRDIIFGLSLERRGGFVTAQQDLDQINNQLLQDLFPPPPPPKPRRKRHARLPRSLAPRAPS
ncbi:MAG TPA: hypothetical protein VGS20_07645 [Candidatus Acidoferrales bacterium]|nr:hypothetical protein [Candidatus Acidoferrales bacterium]